MSKKILAILGPTATGKTDIGIMLAKKLNGEIISCDSRQVYKGLDIGTGKLPSINSDIEYSRHEGFWIMDGVKIWMTDVADPKDRYDVFQFVNEAVSKIAEIETDGKLPILVGGTGLYLRALYDGLPNLEIPTNADLRRELEALTFEEVAKKLEILSPSKWESMNGSERKNKRRIIRAIELITMSPRKSEKALKENPLMDCDLLKIGLVAPRVEINKKIDKRVLSRIEEGLITEAERLVQMGLTFERMRELGLEYGCLADLLEGKINRDEFALRLQTKIHQFAKRQMTWFKKENGINWFDITEDGFINKVEKQVCAWYNQTEV